MTTHLFAPRGEIYMTDDDNLFPSVAEEIDGVWGDHDDFEEGGWQYAAFVIREDLREMEAEEWDDEACLREMTDVAINAIRAIEELGLENGVSYERSIHHRLKGHEDKGTEKLVERYQRLFENRL